jgi:hypothetical protein
MKKCSPYLEIKIKTKLRFHLTPVRMTIKDVGKKGPLYTAGGNLN